MIQIIKVLLYGLFCLNDTDLKESCDVFYSGDLSPSEERVQVAMEELQDLKGVWNELSKIWEQVDDLKDKPWLSVQPRKVGNIYPTF